MPSILTLVLVGLPLHIAWLIMAIIVYSTNCHVGWRISNISPKIGENFPIVTNPNSSCTIPVEIFPVRVVATSHHIVPDGVNFRMDSVPALSMSGGSFSVRFPLQTPTGFCVTAFQAVNCGIMDCSTGTTTHYALGEVFGCGIRNMVPDYFKSSKSLSDERDFSRHGIGSFNVVFSGGNPARTGPRCDLLKSTEFVKL